MVAIGGIYVHRRSWTHSADHSADHLVLGRLPVNITIADVFYVLGCIAFLLYSLAALGADVAIFN